MTLLGYLCKIELENLISHLISTRGVHWTAPSLHWAETEMVPSKPPSEITTQKVQ